MIPFFYYDFLLNMCNHFEPSKKFFGKVVSKVRNMDTLFTIHKHRGWAKDIVEGDPKASCCTFAFD